MRTIPRFRLLFFATEQKREMATSGSIQNNNKNIYEKESDMKPGLDWLSAACMIPAIYDKTLNVVTIVKLIMLLRNLTPINFDEKKYFPKNPYCISLIIQLCKVCCTNPVLYPCIYKDVKNAFKYKNREKKSDINNTS